MNTDTSVELTRRFADEQDIDDIVAVVVAPELEETIESPHGASLGIKQKLLTVALALCCSIIIVLAIL